MYLEVMIVDDDPVFRLIVGTLLKQAGIKPPHLICTNGEEALKLLEQQISKEKMFLIFLDINMPVLDGWGVLDSLKHFPHKENIRVAMVTSSVNKADKELALTYEQVISYLVKPLKREDLSSLMSSGSLAPFLQTNE
ncbi:MAG: response regulator [Niabella sp.]